LLDGNTQINRSTLSGPTQQLVSTSQRSLNQLADELGRTSTERSNAIQQKAQSLFERQSQGINQDANDTLGRVRSDLSKRFGSSQNSTFGNDLLARVENDRLNRLNDSRQHSDLLAEDLQNADEDSKIRRANVFYNFLNGVNSDARGINQSGASLVLNENQRATSLAVSRANALQQYYNQEALRRSRQASLAQITPTVVGAALGTALGQPALGATVGSQIGRLF